MNVQTTDLWIVYEAGLKLVISAGRSVRLWSSKLGERALQRSVLP
jgi:hypothetical protein